MKCSKCGTEMRTPNYMHAQDWCPKCGHEEKVNDKGEKVGGEKDEK